jgi:hypothetical protein
MAAVFDSDIDKALFAVLTADDADAAAALLAVVAVLDDFAISDCSLLTCSSRVAIRASMGLRSVQPAVSTSKAKMDAFAIVVTPFLRVKSRPTHAGISLIPVSQDSGLSAYCNSNA